MKKSWACFIMVVGVFLATLSNIPVSASNRDTADSLECNGGTVTRGDSKATVRAMCGKPTDVYGENVEETWVYNFGPDRDIYYITFTGELVSLIQSGDYGN